MKFGFRRPSLKKWIAARTSVRERFVIAWDSKRPEVGGGLRTLESRLQPGLQQSDARLSSTYHGSMRIGDYTSRAINLLAQPLIARTHGNCLAPV